MLDLFSYQTLANFPDNAVESLLVPHQKYALNCSIQEDTKESSLMLSAYPDMALVRNVYGIIVNQGVPTARALEEGENNPAPFFRKC